MRQSLTRLFRVAAATLASGVMFASSAAAYSKDAGEEAGPGWSVFETVLWFIGAPLAIIAAVWVLWSIPQWRHSSAPATGDNWNPQPSSDVVQR